MSKIDHIMTWLQATTLGVWPEGHETGVDGRRSGDVCPGSHLNALHLHV